RGCRGWLISKGKTTLHIDSQVGGFCQNVQGRAEPHASLHGGKTKDEGKHDDCYETRETHGQIQIQIIDIDKLCFKHATI
ncbi:predicted protein, partial [Nematostella vectensis]